MYRGKSAPLSMPQARSTQRLVRNELLRLRRLPILTSPVESWRLLIEGERSCLSSRTALCSGLGGTRTSWAGSHFIVKRADGSTRRLWVGEGHFLYEILDSHLLAMGYTGPASGKTDPEEADPGTEAE